MSPYGLLFGPMLIGTYANTILYGIVLVQVYFYFQTYKHDEKWIRRFILYLLLVETVNTCFNIVMMYEPLIVQFGTPAAMEFLPLGLYAEPLVTVAISTPVQIFYAWRIHLISKSILPVLIICLFSLVSLAGAVWLTHTIAIVQVWRKAPELHWPALLWLVSTAVVDVTITISLTVALLRRKTGYTGTDDVIRKIIRLTVQTGLITGLFAILDVVSFLALPYTGINFVFDFALSKLYTNAIMSSLNARAGWNHAASTPAVVFSNVLFDEDGDALRGAQVKVFPRIGAASRTQPTHELDVRRSTTDPLGKPQHSIQYGITITKEVEIQEEASMTDMAKVPVYNDA